MASLTERLKFIVDLDANGAIKGLGRVGNAADKELGKAESRLDKTGASMTKFGAGALGAAGIISAGLFKAGQAASDLGESVNAVNVTFGDSAAGVLELGENAATSVGLANAEFNGLAVQFSAFATTIAGEGGNVTNTLDDMTTRAADFASVMNIDVKDAATLFQSGLAGETEPLRKFGIDLSAAAVEAYAYANGIAEAGAKLTEAEKVQARYGSLMEQTAKAQGDFANTADSAANAQRIAAAEMENAMASLGESVAPIMAEVAGAVSKVASTFSGLNEATDGWLGKAIGIGTVALGAAGALSFLTGKGILLRDSFKEGGNINKLVTGLKNIPPAGGAAVVALGAVVAGVWAYNKGVEQAEERTAALTENAAEFATVADEALGELFAQRMGQAALDVVLSGKDMEDSFNNLAETSLHGAKRMLEYGEANGLNAESMDLLRAAIERKEDADSDAAKAAERLADTTEETTTSVRDNAEALFETVDATKEAAKATKDWEDRLAEAAENTEAISRKQDDFGQSLDISSEALEEQKQALEDQAKALDEAREALEDQIDAQRSAADAQYALRDSTDSYNEYLEGLNEATKEAKGDQDALNKIYRDGTTATTALADATVRAYTDQAAANGVTLSATEKLNIWNTKMLETAATQDGPLKQSTLDYIIAVNGIPEEKATEIRAAMAEGDLPLVNQLLQESTRDRQVSIIPELVDSKFNIDLNALLTKPYSVGIAAKLKGIGAGGLDGDPLTPYATGTTSARRGFALVGEKGPEIVGLNGGEQIIPNNQLGSLGGVTNVYNLTVNTGADPNQVITILKEYTRRGGRF